MFFSEIFRYFQNAQTELFCPLNFRQFVTTSFSAQRLSSAMQVSTHYHYSFLIFAVLV
jgi:hypothetical protein